ncbi:ABC transporter ATP-binding protein [Tissierella sp. MB52-C2]|uniref:ABC transporter ATP-binding protein n=1 Tax=Tissierella sp. MB52-C2 TaxID=3070999 RepID=UPI00280BB0B9|nr:ABC transporter ATP-binding protein [Tissierella sp. MB52-C2]WMM26145.1 ABC transporter ATP-binding protein [Tissierella sp. MB52-C2]
MQIVKINYLKKYFGEEPNIVKAVDDIELFIDEGEFVSIIGDSGSGKTTLLNLIGGVDRPTSGEIIIANQDINELTNDELTRFRRKHIGFIFQNYNLVSILNVRENILLPLDLDDRQYDEEYFNEIVSTVGIDDKLEEFPAKLSGGQQQRVAIARALITKPKIILADEPTGNLDHKNGENIINLLIESNQRFNQTILMITHNLELAKKANRILEILDGKIVKEKIICKRQEIEDF